MDYTETILRDYARDFALPTRGNKYKLVLAVYMPVRNVHYACYFRAANSDTETGAAAATTAEQWYHYDGKLVSEGEVTTPSGATPVDAIPKKIIPVVLVYQRVEANSLPALECAGREMRKTRRK
jgi:hypothetical protein